MSQLPPPPQTPPPPPNGDPGGPTEWYPAPPPPPPGPPGASWSPSPTPVAAATPLPSGVQVSSVGRRLGGYLLDGLLAIVTLFIGWFVWSLIVWNRSQTPGKQLLKMKTVKKDTGERATYGTMVLREVVGKWLIVDALIGSLCLVAVIVLDFMLLWDKDRQQLWDKIAGTIIVDDPDDVLV
jgi:uncharacterized RDD family membrane protein YckC